MSMNTSEVRVVDPILSNHSRGYKQSGFVGHYLFPHVDCPARGVKVLRFGKEGFRLYSSNRAPGTATKRVQFHYESDVVNLKQNALEGVLPREHLQEGVTVPGAKLGERAVNTPNRSIALEKEVGQAQKARDLNNYGANNKLTLIGAARWNDPASDPETDIDDAKEAIRQSIGMDPNTLVLSPKVFKALRRHPSIKDQFKYTDGKSITLGMLAEYFDIETVVVGKGVSVTGANDDFNDIWGTDAILAYVPGEGESDMEVPSYGYTYRLSGHPFVEEKYYDKNAKSWIYPVTDEKSIEMTSPLAGFIFKTAVD